MGESFQVTSRPSPALNRGNSDHSARSTASLTASSASEPRSLDVDGEEKCRASGSSDGGSISRRSSRKSAGSTTGPADTPQAGTFLARFISSFRPTAGDPSRPPLPRSLSSPSGVPLGAKRSPRTSDRPVPSSSSAIMQNAAASTSTLSLKRFRPSFKRRATTTGFGSDVSPSSTPPLSSPALIPDQQTRPTQQTEKSGEEAFEGRVRPRVLERHNAARDVGQRESITSQKTLQQVDLGLDTGAGSPAATRTSTGPGIASLDHPPRPPIENPLSLIATLLPTALSLLSQLGPSHLFSPPLFLPNMSTLFDSSSNSGAPPHASDSASFTSSRTSASQPFTLPTSVQNPSYTHELHAPSTVSVPAVSAAAIWRLFRGFEWIGEVGRNGYKSPMLDTDEDDKVFDFPAVLQGVADVLAAEAAARRVELVIGQVGSGSAPSPVNTPPVDNAGPPEDKEKTTASRELLVRADERGWGVVLIWIIHHILAGAQPGATVEVRFLATLASGPPVNIVAETSFDSQGTALPTRRSLQLWWTISLEIIHTFATVSPFDRGAPSPTQISPPFFVPFAKSLFSYLDLKLEDSDSDESSQSWVLEALLPAPPAALIEEDEPSTSSTLLNRRRANLSSPGHEPSLEDLKKFAEEGLKGTRVALHAGEQSTFAKHLTTYLAGWGMDVSHVPLDSDHWDASSGSTQEDVAWAKGKREGAVRFDSGFAGSSSSEINSPTATNGAPSLTTSPKNINFTELPSPVGSSSGASSAESSSSSLVIIDDDIATLRRMLLAFRAPPLHYAPTLLTKRPQLVSRRTRSSPHVRQVHQIPQTPSGLVIVHFASLTHYKAIKEIVQDALATSRSPNLPEVLVIPKPAGPRRIITALWTAVRRPPVDPSLSPIATSPTSPGIQYWTPRLSPALANQQDFDFAAAEALSSKGDHQSSSGSTKARTPPIYFPGSPVGHPPSPLGKISDDQVSYFSCVAENLDGTTPSEGMVIQSPNGRPAIFFQPQTRMARAASAKDKGPSRLSEQRDDDTIDPSDATTPPSRGSVAAPHEIGLGQPRRVSSYSSATSADSITILPIGTPALTLDSFITAAKSRAQSPETLKGDDPKSPVEPMSLPRRSSSILSASRSIGSPRQVPTPPYPRRSIPAVSPPISPRPMSPTPSIIGVSTAAPRILDATPAAGTSSPVTSRRASGADRSSRARRNTTRKTNLPTVPPINVLIVEDNPINQTILSMFMKKKGIKYAVAKDGEEAVQKWKAGDFHLVLMDIQLPVKDGITATREIREMERLNNVGTFITTPNADSTSPATSSHSASVDGLMSPLLSMPVIIVALTASSLQIDRVTALAAGCNDFLTKPVSLPWLQQKLLEWGSMAYLSGFSRRSSGSDSIPGGSTPSLRSSAFSAGLGSTTKLQAEAISAHLYIEHKGLPTRSVQSTPPHQGPSLLVSSPTPIMSPAVFSTAPPLPFDSAPPVQPVVAPPVESGAEELVPTQSVLEAVDHKLEDLVSKAAAAQRPGPSPLSPMGAATTVVESQSLESVVRQARSRASSRAGQGDSFSSMMQHESGVSSDPTSAQHLQKSS